MNKKIDVGYLQLLRTNSQFRNLWIGSVVSQIGDWFSYVAVLGLVWELTGSGTVLALTMISRAIPFSIAGMVAGVALDRYDRRKILIISDLLRALLAIGYIFVHSPNLIWLVYVLGGAMQTFTAFFSPGVNALTPNIVAKEELGTANALRQSTFGATMILGSAIGGVILAYIGRDMTFILNSISFLLSGYFIWRVKVNLKESTEERKTTYWEDFVDGLRYLWKNTLALALVLRRIGERLGAGFNLLISIFAIEVWRAGESGIGLLYSILGLGLIFGGVIAKRLSSGNDEKLKGIVGYANIGEGIFWLLFCLSPNIYLGGVMLALMVGSDIISSVTDTTLLQRNVPDKYLGRIFSAKATLLTLSWSAALGLTGFVLNFYTPQQTGYGISVIMLLTALLWLIAYWLGKLKINQTELSSGKKASV